MPVEAAKSEAEYAAYLGYAKKLLTEASSANAYYKPPDMYRKLARLHLRRALGYATKKKQTRRRMAILRALKQVKRLL